MGSLGLSGGENTGSSVAIGAVVGLPAAAARVTDAVADDNDDDEAGGGSVPNGEVGPATVKEAALAVEPKITFPVSCLNSKIVVCQKKAQFSDIKKLNIKYFILKKNETQRKNEMNLGQLLAVFQSSNQAGARHNWKRLSLQLFRCKNVKQKVGFKMNR